MSRRVTALVRRAEAPTWLLVMHRGWWADLPPAFRIPSPGRRGLRKGAGRTSSQPRTTQSDPDPGAAHAPLAHHRPRHLTRTGAAHRRTPPRPPDGARARAPGAPADEPAHAPPAPRHPFLKEIPHDLQHHHGRPPV